VVPGDAAATAKNILASESLVRLSVASALLSQVSFVFVAVALYRLFKVVDKNMAMLMTTFLLLGVPIAMLNEVNHLAVLLLLHDAPCSAAFRADELHALAGVFLDLRAQGLSIAGILWGLWLFPMGYLVFKSEFLPRVMKIVGVLLMTIGCFGYLAQSAADLLLPHRKLDIVPYTGWVEAFLPLWLLIRGLDVERWKKQALEHP
jgi:hypothetical protein